MASSLEIITIRGRVSARVRALGGDCDAVTGGWPWVLYSQSHCPLPVNRVQQFGHRYSRKSETSAFPKSQEGRESWCWSVKENRSCGFPKVSMTQ